MTKWQPIETAPKTGCLVTMGWLVDGSVEHTAEARWLGSAWSDVYTPTHWYNPSWQPVKMVAEDSAE